MKLFNTLTRKKEEFKPINKDCVTLYTCGPTVYSFAHIGNLRTYIFEDILKKVLEYNGYNVKHVMNITDVGHLTSDEDEGEDKLEKGAKRENKTVLDIVEFYTNHFKKDLTNLNIKDPTIWIKATETIDDQINLIKILEEKGYTYTTSDGVYFDTSKDDDYGVLWGSKEKTDFQARIEQNKEKKNPSDFALWKFSPKNEKRQMEWMSPWGIGFPGWHTECVVMASKFLGIPLDIHCGGIDHVSVHHTNEIAQAKAAYEKPLANFWMHGEFLTLKDDKMSKSKGNILILDTLNTPLAYRYLCLTAHYKTQLIYSKESIEAAESALKKLKERINKLELHSEETNPESKNEYLEKFKEYINDDLDTPKALALTWEIIKEEKISDKEKYDLIQEFDKIFSLNLQKEENAIPEHILQLAIERDEYRDKKDWNKSDEIRKEIEKQGFAVEDTPQGTKILPQ
jgi:cysteinyl-tRNA synthetase